MVLKRVLACITPAKDRTLELPAHGIPTRRNLGSWATEVVGRCLAQAVAQRDTADSDFLKMVRAGLFVVGRGGFSRTIELMRIHCKLPCVRIPEITANYEYSTAEQRRPATRNHNHNRRTPDGSDMDST